MTQIQGRTIAKISWFKLLESKCPTLYCVTGKTKTNLIQEGNVLRCPKCQGQWMYHMGMFSWVQLIDPVFRRQF